MKRNPLVSIIIPCYNSSSTISNAINSVLIQDYANIEIVIVNDGSTDDTEIVLKKYTNLSKFVYIKQENQGVSNARNKGIAVAKGEFIMFLDSDDSYRQGYISQMVSKIISENADAVITPLNKSYSDNSGVISFHELLKSSILNRMRIGFYSAIYKKKLIQYFDIEFPPNISYGEDQVFLWSYMIHTKKIGFVNKIFYQYNDNDSSAMHNISEKILTALDAQRIILQKVKLNRPEEYDFMYKYGYSKEFFYIISLCVSSKRYDIVKGITKNYNLRKIAFNILGYPKIKVNIGAFVCILSPSLFFLISKISHCLK